MRKNIVTIVIAIILSLSVAMVGKSYVDMRLAKMEIDTIKDEQANVNIFKNISEVLKIFLQININQNKAIEQINTQLEKPSYEYLKSITVFITGTIPEKIQENGATRITKSWAGTGSIITIKDGYTYILTNNHVTGYKEPNFSEVKLNVVLEKEKYSAEVIKNSTKCDMAVIRIKGELKGKRPIKGYSTVQIQDKVYSVGNYLALENIYTEGSVAGYYEDKYNYVTYLICNLPSAFGCSGSIVTNSKGEGVALIFAIFNVGMFSPDTSKAITVRGEDIQEFLKELNLK